MREVLVRSLKFRVGKRLLHFEVIHKLGWIAVTRSLCDILFLKQRYRIIDLTMAYSRISYRVSLALRSLILLICISLSSVSA